MPDGGFVSRRAMGDRHSANRNAESFKRDGYGYTMTYEINSMLVM
jgi:hypothetical protein